MAHPAPPAPPVPRVLLALQGVTAFLEHLARMALTVLMDPPVLPGPLVQMEHVDPLARLGQRQQQQQQQQRLSNGKCQS